jgi:hypothetical protein
MLYATRAKTVIALDVSHSPAALATIFTSRAIIIHFLHLLHKLLFQLHHFNFNALLCTVLAFALVPVSMYL